jgi:hypothetical protein
MRKIHLSIIHTALEKSKKEEEEATLLHIDFTAIITNRNVTTSKYKSNDMIYYSVLNLLTRFGQQQ